MSQCIALIGRAIGFVGKEFVSYLLTKDYYSKIKILSRRRVDHNDDQVEIMVMRDFNDPDNYKYRPGTEDHCCTLGITIKK